MLAVSPDILILDEATAMLDPSSRENIYEILRSFNRRGSTIIHITHDLDAVKEAGDVIGLEEGRIFFNGTSADFLKKPGLVRKIRGELVKKAEKMDLSGREVSFSFDKGSFSFSNKL